VDKFETTEVNSSDVMSSMQPSERSMATGRGSMPLFLSFTSHSDLFLSLSFSISLFFSIYRDRVAEVAVAVAEGASG
jgi:hypothetical protein